MVKAMVGCWKRLQSHECACDIKTLFIGGIDIDGQCREREILLFFGGKMVEALSLNAHLL